MDDPPITPEEQAEADRFYQAFGRTLGQWGLLEYYLGLMFQQITNMEEVVSRNVFHSARSWRARYDMLTGGLNGSASRPGVVTSWREIVNTANQYSAFRNILAHDQVQLGRDFENRRVLVIRPPRADLDILSPHPIIRRPDIETAGENFKLLGALVVQAIKWPPDDQLGAPERLIWLNAQLPNPPHSKRVDPTVVEQFSLGLERQPFPA